MSAPVDPPEATAPVETAAPEPTAPQPGPWAADLAEYLGADNTEALAAADRYMREKVQPRITTLETDTAPARALWQDLSTDPENTLRDVIAELWTADDVPDQFKAFFEQTEEQPAEQPDEQLSMPTDEPPEWAKPLLERDQAAREAEVEAEQERLYQEVLSELRQAHPDLTDHDMDHIHPFMASAPDPETAYAGYKAYKDSLLGQAQPAPMADDPAPPPVLGADGSTAATPPIQKDYKNIDEAMDDWFAERRAVAPPVVGNA